ncbi:Uncharacterised protein [uncultured archaeon]|nr:Uncharacterised protein [uncultured archaeon]
MSEQIKSNQKRHQKPHKSTSSVPTAEEKAAALAATEKQAAELKAEQERVALYGEAVKHMSHRQLCAELQKTLNRERVKVGKGIYDPIPGLTGLYATVLLNVLNNTKTPTRVFEADSDGKPTRVGRLDQINQLGALPHFLR